jgi:hypothetical protein
MKEDVSPPKYSCEAFSLSVRIPLKIKMNMFLRRDLYFPCRSRSLPIDDVLEGRTPFYAVHDTSEGRMKKIRKRDRGVHESEFKMLGRIDLFHGFK